MQVAAIYRVSTEKQVRRDEADSIPLQQHAVRAFVGAREGWCLVREYAEEGVSGFKVSAADRDVLQQALEDGRCGHFQVLVVFKADRLSRNALEYPLVIDRFRRLGVAIWSVADAPGGKLLSLETQMDKFIRFLEGWQAESESQNTSIRVSEAMRQMAREGRWTGGPPPFGFRLNPLRRRGSSLPPLLLDEAQAAAVRRMVDLYLEERMGCYRIAAQLNREGVPHPSGRPWDGQRVRRILQNPIIAGLPAYGRTQPGQAGRRNQSPYLLERFILPRDEAGNLRPVPGYEIVPVARWLFLMAQMQARGGREGKPARQPVRPARRLLAGLLICAHCGAKLAAGVGAEGRPYYICQTHLRVGRTGCDGQRTYGARRLEAAVLAQLQHLLTRVDPAELAEAIRLEQSTGEASARARRRSLQAELSRAERVLQGWLSRLEAQMGGGESGYSEELLKARIWAAESRYRELREALTAGDVPPGALQQSATEPTTAGAPPSWWDSFIGLDPQAGRLLLPELLSEVRIGRNRLELRFRVDLKELLG